MTKQQLIMQKAIELFTKKSISKTSIQDITNACGISKGAFYLSYASKEHLLVAIVEHFIKDLSISFQKVIDKDESPKVKLELFCSTTMSIFYEHFPLIKMLISENTGEMKSEIIVKVQIFDQLLTKNILILLEDTYGSAIQHNKFDIQLCIKGIIHSYTDFIIHHNHSYPFKEIAKTIIQYIDAIVEKQIASIISEEVFYSEYSISNSTYTLKNTIINELTNCKKHYDSSSFYGETLYFIENEVHKDEPNFVILNGMAANLSREPDLQWLSTLIKQFAPIPL